MFSRSRLREEGVEGVIPGADRFVGRHLAIGLDAVLEAIKLPAGIANLAASLSDVDGDALTLQSKRSGDVDHTHFNQIPSGQVK